MRIRMCKECCESVVRCSECVVGCLIVKVTALVSIRSLIEVKVEVIESSS